MQSNEILTANASWNAVETLQIWSKLCKEYAPAKRLYSTFWSNISKNFSFGVHILIVAPLSVHRVALRGEKRLKIGLLYIAARCASRNAVGNKQGLSHTRWRGVLYVTNKQQTILKVTSVLKVNKHYSSKHVSKIVDLYSAVIIKNL